MPDNKPCGCGRSMNGCIGLHLLSNEDYKKYLEKQQSLQENVRPELLKG
jgi:hypothetical protein